MNRYQMKILSDIRGMLEEHFVLDDKEEDQSFQKLTSDLADYVSEECRKSFLNGLKRSRNPGNQTPSAVRAGILTPAKNAG